MKLKCIYQKQSLHGEKSKVFRNEKNLIDKTSFADLIPITPVFTSMPFDIGMIPSKISTYPFGLLIESRCYKKKSNPVERIRKTAYLYQSKNDISLYPIDFKMQKMSEA